MPRPWTKTIQVRFHKEHVLLGGNETLMVAAIRTSNCQCFGAHLTKIVELAVCCNAKSRSNSRE
jgi:hypothetical protein